MSEFKFNVGDRAMVTPEPLHVPHLPDPAPYEVEIKSRHIDIAETRRYVVAVPGVDETTQHVDEDELSPVVAG